MNCEEAGVRIPDDGPEVAEHLAECAACRAKQAAYVRDADDLAAGLRELAGKPGLDASILRPRASSPRRTRSFIPLAAAAAIALAIIGAIILRPEPQTTAPEHARQVTERAPLTPYMVPYPASLPSQLLLIQSSHGLDMIASTKATWGQVVSVDVPEGRVSVSISKADVTGPGQKFIVYRQTGAGYLKIGTLTIDKVEDSLSHGPVMKPRLAPRAGDFVVPARFLTHAEKTALVEYVFSFSPISRDERSFIQGVLGKLQHPSFHDDVAPAFAAYGGQAAVVLALLEKEGASADRLAPGRRALDAYAPVSRLVRGSGLERNVEFLARLEDPRAYPRLKRILGDVEPFAREGLPEAGPELASRLHAWWAEAQNRVRWNPTADRYEDR